MRLLLLALLLSCGGSASQGVLCRVTIGSNTKDKIPCARTASSTGGEGSLRAHFTHEVFADIDFAIEVAFSGEMRTGTFTDTDAGAHSTITYDSGFATISSYVETINEGAPKQGSYSMTLTNIGAPVTSGGVTTYPDAHGTLTASLISTANGNALQLNATF